MATIERELQEQANKQYTPKLGSGIDVERVDTEDGEVMIVNMGPQHPSTHGVLRLVVELNGDRKDDGEHDVLQSLDAD
jgi:hypothetical protein